MTLDPKQVKSTVQRMTTLPTLPVILHNIVKTIDDPDSSASDLEEVISNDPSISAKVLSVANSAAYNRGREVTSLTDAVVALGFELVMDVSLSVSFSRFFSSSTGGQEFDRQQFWMHCMASATAARELARHSNYDNPQMAFLMGLVHDVGKVVLDHLFLEEFEQAVAESRQSERPLHECEREVLGFDHAEVGGWLAERWRFPLAIAAAVEYHHRPDDHPPEFQSEVFLALLADVAVREAGVGASGNLAPPVIPPAVLKGLEVSNDEMATVVKFLRDRRDKVQEFLGLTV